MVIENPVEFNGVTINSQSDSDFHTTGFWIRLTAVDGMFGNDIRYESHPISSGTGERSAYAFQSGKSITLTGEVWGKGLAELVEGQWTLASMFWDLQPHKLYFTPWPVNSLGTRLYITCRANQPLAMSDTYTKLNIYFQSFTVGLRSDDPRSYKESDNSAYPTWQS